VGGFDQIIEWEERGRSIYWEGLRRVYSERGRERANASVAGEEKKKRIFSDEERGSRKPYYSSVEGVQHQHEPSKEKRKSLEEEKREPFR